jgi:hypothetical protein
MLDRFRLHGRRMRTFASNLRYISRAALAPAFAGGRRRVAVAPDRDGGCQHDRSLPTRAAELLKRALTAWSFYETHREDAAYHWSHGALLFAGCQLYLATGEARFHEVFREEVNIATLRCVSPTGRWVPIRPAGALPRDSVNDRLTIHFISIHTFILRNAVRSPASSSTVTPNPP